MGGWASGQGRGKGQGVRGGVRLGWIGELSRCALIPFCSHLN